MEVYESWRIGILGSCKIAFLVVFRVRNAGSFTLTKVQIQNISPVCLCIWRLKVWTWIASKAVGQLPQQGSSYSNSPETMCLAVLPLLYGIRVLVFFFMTKAWILKCSHHLQTVTVLITFKQKTATTNGQKPGKYNMFSKSNNMLHEVPLTEILAILRHLKAEWLTYLLHIDYKHELWSCAISQIYILLYECS